MKTQQRVGTKSTPPPVPPWMYELASPIALSRVQKPVNTNLGLKVNRTINFSCTKMFFTSYILCKLRLLKLKTGGKTIQKENLDDKSG